MGNIKNKITKIAKQLFEKKSSKEDLSDTLFSIVKVLKKEEKKMLKAVYPKIHSPLDLEIARILSKKFFSSKD